MKKLKTKLNVTYCFVQALYWMAFCAFLSCSSAYLAACGYTGTVTGVMLALSYGISVALQQVIAAFLDKSRRIGITGLTVIMALVMALGAFLMSLFEERTAALSALFVATAVLSMSMQPLVNALCFHLQKTGVTVNFGVARSMGSVAFSGISVVIGNIIDRYRISYVPLTGMTMTLLMVLALVVSFLISKGSMPLKEDKEERSKAEDEASVDDKTSEPLLKKYGLFFIYLIGIVCFTFGHQTINGFLHYVVEAAGGGDADMGGLLAFQAIVELPAMIFFSRLQKRFGTKKLLMVAATAYSVKAAAALIAMNIPMLYMSMIFQALGFAIFIPGGVQLVHETMDERDAVKGQAFITGAVTVANLIASVSGGVLIDNLGVRMALAIGLAVSVIGTVVSFISLGGMKRQKA